MPNNQILTIIILLAIISIASAIESEVDQLFCELNEYAKQRVLNGNSVFPCQNR